MFSTGQPKLSLSWSAILLIVSMASLCLASSSNDDQDEPLKQLVESFLPKSFLEKPVTASAKDSVKSNKRPRSGEANADELLKAAQSMMSGLKNIVDGLNAPDIGDCAFKCPNGAKPQPKPDHKPISNGCGTHGLKADVSDFPGITDCCNIHDICYETCNRGQAVCDRAFNACMADSCERMHSGGTIQTQKKFTECMAIGATFHLTAMTLGCEFYRQSQLAACLCPSHQSDGATDSQQEKIRHYNSEKRAAIDAAKSDESVDDGSDYLDDIDMSSPVFDLPDAIDRQEL